MNREFMDKKYSEITPEITALADLCRENSLIEKELFTEHKVFRGLRDLQGNGVLTGLTDISEIQAFKLIDGERCLATDSCFIGDTMWRIWLTAS